MEDKPLAFACADCPRKVSHSYVSYTQPAKACRSMEGDTRLQVNRLVWPQRQTSRVRSWQQQATLENRLASVRAGFSSWVFVLVAWLAELGCRIFSRRAALMLPWPRSHAASTPTSL
eukprot:1149054-Amphidinium_carterae.1